MTNDTVKNDAEMDQGQADKHDMPEGVDDDLLDGIAGGLSTQKEDPGVGCNYNCL